MKISVFINNKGEVGKTTSSQNVAAALAKFSGAKVLAIDLDPQGSLTRCFGVDKRSLTKLSTDFIIGAPLEECKIEVNGITLIPANKKISDTIDTIKGSSHFPFNLKKALAKVQDEFDVVIIDCQPSLKEGLTKLALIACTHYFVPLEAKFLSYEGLADLLEYTSEVQEITENATLGGVFATKFNPKIKKKMAQATMNQLKTQLDSYLMDSFIRDNTKLDEAQSYGQNIFDYAPKSNGAKDYYTLTTEFLKRLL
jgi:chromosome partitioning protein